MTNRNDYGNPFAEWMREVDRQLYQYTGFSSEDLEDFTYRDMFEDGLSPEECVAEWFYHHHEYDEMPDELKKHI